MPLTIDNPSALSQLAHVGQPMFLGTSQQTHGGLGAPSLRNMITVPLGQCFVITKVHFNPVLYAAGFVGSPALNARAGTESKVLDSAGTEIGTLGLNEFTRWRELFNASAADTWRNAPPDNTVDWDLKTPIALAPGASLRNQQTNLLHNGIGAFGYMVPQDIVHQLNIPVIGTTNTQTAGVESFSSTSGGATVLAGRAGYCIQILDLIVRQQPLATAATSTLTLRQAGDSRNIFQFTNGNPANLCQKQFSPNIFLREGQGLEVISTTTGTGTGTFTYRYVPIADVPGDHWWACQAPAKAAGGAVAAQAANTTLTLYYPKSNTTATLAPKGRQHILHGYVATAQFDNTLPTASIGGVTFRIGAGAAAGDIGNVVASIAASGTQMTPLHDIYSHEQTVWAGSDDLNMIAPAEGGLFFESQAQDAVAVPAGGRIRDWFIMAWGRTLPTRFTGTINRGAV